MAGTAGTKGVPRAARERQILDVAGEEFGRLGYAHASVNDIARRAGISKPLIYGYFGSKDGLYLACLDRAGTALVDAVTTVAAAPHGVSLVRAADTLAAIFEVLQERRHDWPMLYDPTLPAGSAVEEAARRYRRELDELGAEGAAEVLAAAGDTEPGDQSLLTQVWLSAVTAVITWWLRHPEETAAAMTRRCTRITTALLASAGA